MTTKVWYEAKGVVLGDYWMGGKGWYTAEKKKSTTLSDLRKQIKEGVKSGKLDTGMGYEKVTGAVMQVKKFTYKTISGKVFVNTEYLDPIVIGDADEVEGLDVISQFTR